MMKYLFPFFMALSLVFAVNAQKLDPEVQSVLDACLSMRAAIGSGNSTQLKNANKKLKATNYVNWGKPKRIGATPSLDGHYIFDTEFADSLINNRSVYKFAQRYGNKAATRGTGIKGKVFLLNLVIPKGTSAKYSLAGKGRQNIVVITEPKGAVTLRVYDKVNKKYYNDTKHETKGEAYRKKVISLPADKSLPLEIEIINTCDHDISVALIGN